MLICVGSDVRRFHSQTCDVALSQHARTKDPVRSADLNKVDGPCMVCRMQPCKVFVWHQEVQLLLHESSWTAGTTDVLCYQDTGLQNGACSFQWDLLVWCIRQKMFLASRFTFALSAREFPLFSAWGKCYKYKTSMGQQFRTERVIIDVICSSGCPVNSFTDVSFTVVVYGKSAFSDAGEFFATVP